MQNEGSDGEFYLTFESSESAATKPIKVKSSNRHKRIFGRWTELEHQKFVEALKLYGKDWNKV